MNILLQSKVLNNHGIHCGSSYMLQHSDLAEKNRPVLRQFDPYGRRIDIIDYHPSYHELMKYGLQVGSASYGYNNEKDDYNSHLTRAALIYMQNQLEPGHCCPIVMTSACVPVFSKLSFCEEWLKKCLVQDYDGSDKPIEEKNAITVGMSMTEKQGGSDVRANTTIAKPIDPSKIYPGAEYVLTGHKWFTSAPMSDGFLTLAKVEGTELPSLFLVPRWLPDGSRNIGFRVVRLKDKCADRANASSEIEYDNAYAILLSEYNQGVKSIIAMVQNTRLDCCLGSAGGMRKALQLAMNHVNTRIAFGKPLIQQPLMENVLTDLCVEAEISTIMAMRIASFSNQQDKAELFRIGVAVSKYYITKRQPQFVYECMEVFGGNGFVEDMPMAKLFRHSPLNSIWEGSGNVIALDVLKSFKSIPLLMNEIELAKGMDSTFDSFCEQLKVFLNSIKDPLSYDSQLHARMLSDYLAIAFQGSLLLRFGNNNTTTAFIRTHFKNKNGINYGGRSVYEKSLREDILNENIPVFHC